MARRLKSPIIIVGGGVIGLGVAYHLAKLGWSDVLLLERNELTSGTSWHAAGIVGPLRASMNLTRLAIYATDVLTTHPGATICAWKGDEVYAVSKADDAGKL